MTMGIELESKDKTKFVVQRIQIFPYKEIKNPQKIATADTDIIIGNVFVSITNWKVGYDIDKDKFTATAPYYVDKKGNKIYYIRFTPYYHELKEKIIEEAAKNEKVQAAVKAFKSSKKQEKKEDK